MAAPLQNNPQASPSTAPVVQYYDPTGTLQTLAPTSYLVDPVSRPGRLVLAPGAIWPTVQAGRGADAVQITYVVGWTNPYLVPERIKQGIRMYLSYLECDREGTSGNAAQAAAAAQACWDDRVKWIPICA